MEITHIAHSCFEIKGKNLSLVIDPFNDGIGYDVPKLKAEVLLMTHTQHDDHNNSDAVSGVDLTIDGPGEYETKGVSVLGLKTYHDNVQGEDRGRNTIYLIEIDGFNVLHLGDLGHKLTTETLEKIPDVDVLMIPVGGVYTIDGETAAKVISALEPGIVIPMHYKTDKLTIELDSIDKFLNEMGAESPTKEAKLKLSRKTDVPEETEVVILEITA